MSGLRRAALFTLAILLAAPAYADNTADEADLAFRRGGEAYRAKHYEDALAEFFHSNRLVHNNNVVQNIARCYEQLQMYDEAYRYWRGVLGENPKGEDKRAIEASLARLASRVALLQVATTPPGAEIYVERKDLGSLGTSPQTLALPAGKTTVILALPGHREARHTVELSAGRTAHIEAELEFIWGRVKLGGDPAGAEVRVDKTEGPPEVTLPGVLKVKPGPHILNVSAAGYLSLQVPVDLKGDQEIEATPRLQPLPAATGNVVVTANHEGAMVRVDGKESGFTPTVIPLVVGSHKVEVTMADMRSWEQTVQVETNTTVQVRADLHFGGEKTTAASKTETSTEDAPASITVINRDEIVAFGYRTLSEALRAVRGIFWTYDRQYESLGVRGFAPPGDKNNRILILWDGHAVGDVLSGVTFVGEDLDVDLGQIERIEIVRGPVSSLFGTGAFFGVINLVPRRHLADHYVEVTGRAGSLGLYGGRATGAYRAEQGELLLSIAGATQKGDEYYPVPDDAGTLVHDQDRELAFHGTLRGRYKGFSLMADVQSRGKDLPTGASNTILGAPGTRVKDQRLLVEARFDHQFEDTSTLQARAYYDSTRYRGYWEYPEGEQTDHTEADWAGAELRYRTRELARMHITAGVEVQEQFRLHMGVETVGVPGLDDTHTFLTVVSGYLVDELRVADWMLINASARADEYLSGFGFTINPRLAIIAKPWKGGVLKAMGGKSFRAPSDYERYYNDNDGTTDPLTGLPHYISLKPNPDLKPENIYTAELELTQEIGGDLKITAAGFFNWITDLLNYATDPSDGLLWTVNATGLVRTQGAELEVRWQPQRLMLVSASYSFQNMIITGVADPADRARLKANAPNHVFAVRGMFPISAPYLVGSIEGVYNSPRLNRDGTGTTGELFFLDVGISGELPGGQFRYFAGAKNLLDERPQLPTGGDVDALTVPTYGRTFLVKLTGSY